MDRRRAPRFKAKFDTLCSNGEQGGAGVLTDISYVGARLEEVSQLPDLGANVTLYVFVEPAAPVELSGHVARLTETGIAIHFDLFDDEVRLLVDDIEAAVVSTALE